MIKITDNDGEHALIFYKDEGVVVLNKNYNRKIAGKQTELRFSVHLANNKQEIRRLYDFFGNCLNKCINEDM